MALIEWTDDCSVRIAEIDGQHKKMVDIINRLHTSMQDGKDEDVLAHIFQDLVTYSATHLVREEELMEKYGYPYFEEHKKEHVFLTEQLGRIKSDYDRGVSGMSMALLLFLRDWLVKHIKESDRRYSDYLNARGVV